MQMLLGAKHREINRPAAKLKNVGLQVFWCLFYIKKMLQANQAQGDQQTSTQIEKCWPVGGLLMLFVKNIETAEASPALCQRI